MTAETSTTPISLSYWKDVESLRAFAQGPAQRAGWDCWNRTMKSHPHIGIMHEVFAAPRGHWESICVNMEPFGMDQMELPGGEGAGGLRSALVRAQGPKWMSMLGRMSRVDMFEGYEAEED
ncbi:hypothetical protein HO133_002850 [Letharia lupina]|uniref:Uncharacterized protein n=1 Tax=Letharia lupina TaxID=560253 RepID=A0A8H6CBR9_9LECA|nr:uncharacterized protein HO133_002850 [Letharia lupina]KAF6220418.1 hypothetical protein HO133_002850 [Letharia lupina]